MNTRTRSLIYAYAVLALSAASLTLIKKKRYRRFGVRPFLQRRRKYGQFEKMFLHMKEFEQSDFISYTRMTPKSFDYLLSLVEIDLRRHPSKKNAIKPPMKLALTLQQVYKMNLKIVSLNVSLF